MATSAVYRSKFDPSVLMVTSPYEWKILEWDEKPINKQTIQWEIFFRDLFVRFTNVHKRIKHKLISFSVQIIFIGNLFVLKIRKKIFWRSWKKCRLVSVPGLVSIFRNDGDKNGGNGALLQLHRVDNSSFVDAEWWSTNDNSVYYF